MPLSPPAQSFHWRTSLSASFAHAADALYRNREFTDAAFADSLREPAQRIHVLAQSGGFPVDRFWRHLAALAGENTPLRDLADRVIRKCNPGMADPMANRLKALLAELRSRFVVQVPDVQEQLAHRMRPLREQWEAMGPGLLRLIAGQTTSELLVDSCQIVIVHPVLGGGGAAHHRYNSVRQEGVLHNTSDLPEVLRLAWLVSQLNLDLPGFSEQIHADRLPYICEFAMIPPTLLAAEQLGLAQFDLDSVRLAIEAWHLTCPPEFAAAETVMNWWDTYTEMRLDFGTAVHALNKMFG